MVQERRPVTEADIGVDTFLRIRLSALLPEAAWLSEETVDDALRLSRRFVWVVDPIDGTRAYMSGLPDWAVCVALLDEGEPILGVVHAPASHATYTTLRGGGAQKNGGAISTTPVSRLGEARIAGPKPMLDALARIEPFKPVDKIPSLALRLARIADGSIDAGLISADARDWDLAAADLILRESGGTMSGGGLQPGDAGAWRARRQRQRAVRAAACGDAAVARDPIAASLTSLQAVYRHGCALADHAALAPRARMA